MSILNCSCLHHYFYLDTLFRSNFSSFSHSIETHRKQDCTAECPRCIDLEKRIHMVHSRASRTVYCKETTTSTSHAKGFIASAKIEEAIKWVQTAVPKNDKAIILSFFKGGLDLIEGILTDELGIECARYDGDIGKKEREKELDKFKTTMTCRVLLATVQSGGTGLNITEANHVLFLDRWFNPCVHDQAESRVHRLGQKKEVKIAYLDCNQTVDVVMKRINVLKEGNASVLLADGTSLGMVAGSLGYRDLSGVIGNNLRAIKEMRCSSSNDNETSGDYDAPLPPHSDSDLETKLEMLMSSKSIGPVIREETKKNDHLENLTNFHNSVAAHVHQQIQSTAAYPGFDSVKNAVIGATKLPSYLTGASGIASSREQKIQPTFTSFRNPYGTHTASNRERERKPTPAYPHSQPHAVHMPLIPSSVIRAHKPNVIQNKSLGNSPAEQFFHRVKSTMTRDEYESIQKYAGLMGKYTQKKHQNQCMGAARGIIRIIISHENFNNRSSKQKPELLILFLQLLPNYFVKDAEQFATDLINQKSKRSAVPSPSFRNPLYNPASLAVPSNVNTASIQRANTKEQRDIFIRFTHVLLNYLMENDRQMYTKALMVTKYFVENEDLKKSTESMERCLRDVVGDLNWKIANGLIEDKSRIAQPAAIRNGSSSGNSCTQHQHQHQHQQSNVLPRSKPTPLSWRKKPLLLPKHSKTVTEKVADKKKMNLDNLKKSRLKRLKTNHHQR
jgi:hypothetical protein